MKHLATTLLITGLFLLAGNMYAEEAAAKPKAGQPELAKLKLSVFKNKVVPLSDKQIAELYETHTDPKTKREYKLVSNLQTSGLRHGKGGKPYRLTATLYEYKTYRGKKIGQRQNGTIFIYVSDADGKTVDEASVSLSKMCPGWGGSGGHLGEVPKAGKYSAVIYIKHAKGYFGKKIDIEF